MYGRSSDKSKVIRITGGEVSGGYRGNPFYRTSAVVFLQQRKAAEPPHRKGKIIMIEIRGLYNTALCYTSALEEKAAERRLRKKEK